MATSGFQPSAGGSPTPDDSLRRTSPRRLGVKIGVARSTKSTFYRRTLILPYPPRSYGNTESGTDGAFQRPARQDPAARRECAGFAPFSFWHSNLAYGIFLRAFPIRMQKVQILGHSGTNNKTPPRNSLSGWCENDAEIGVDCCIEGGEQCKVTQFRRF